MSSPPSSARTARTNDGSPVRLSRRSYLTATIAGVASIATLGAATDVGAAAGGYGYGGFGESGYGDSSVDTSVAVTTGSATDVGETRATLDGSIDDMGGAESVDASFDWREVGASTWRRTAATTLTSAGAFRTEVTGLAADTRYEYRAVATASDGDSDTGTLATVTTDDASTADSPPTVERFTVAEAGSPNPHAEITIDWRVADESGDLDRVSIDVIDAGTGSGVDAVVHEVSGDGATGSDHVKVKHVRGETFEVVLTVTDRAGGTATATRSVTE